MRGLGSGIGTDTPAEQSTETSAKQFGECRVPVVPFSKLAPEIGPESATKASAKHPTTETAQARRGSHLLGRETPFVESEFQTVLIRCF
jgi:hypothetical protein